MLVAVPPLGGALPAGIRGALLFSLTVALYQALPPGAEAFSWFGLAVAGVGELVAGLLLGLPFRLAFDAVRHGGQVLGGALAGGRMSLQGVLEEERENLGGRIGLLAALCAIVALRLDRIVILALSFSFTSLTPGAWIDQGSLMQALIDLGEFYFQVFLFVLAPLATLAICLEVATALGARALDSSAAAESLLLLRSLCMFVLLTLAAPAILGTGASASLTRAAGVVLPAGGPR